MDLTARDDAESTPHGLRPGKVLGGRFRILRFIGAGGMGEVYEADDQELGGTVALKTIRADRLEGGAKFIDRFLQEAKLARQVTHPNICRIFDVGREGQRVFLTMEFIAGETLANLLRSGDRMPIETALALARQIAAGLDALHGRGIVHRDFKTSNILISETAGSGPRAVITDFGLAKPQEETVTLDRGNSVIVGTPDFMAPEQLMGKPVTAASDIYAFGLVLYQMFSGHGAFPGGRILENAVQRFASAPRPPSCHAPDLPRAWDTAILKCLEREPSDRPATASEAVALAMGEIATPRRRRPPKLWFAVAAAVLLLVCAVYLALPAHTPKTATSTAPAVGAHNTYLQAQDSLDHYYRPHGVDDAIRLFEATIHQDPGFALAYAGLARANFQQYSQMRDPKYVEPARANADKALSLDAKLASVHVTLGRLYTETGQHDLAAQEIDEALHLDPRDSEAYYALAALYDLQGRTDEVVPNCQKAIDLAPEDWRLYDYLADFYLRSGKPDKALEYNLKAVNLTPDNPRAVNNLGRIYRRLGRFDEARSAFEKAIQIEPSYSRYANLGVLLEDTGKTEAAATAYRKALELKPDSYVVLGNFGLVLLALPGKEAEAKDAFERAITAAEDLRKSRRDDPELLSILGRNYAIVGQADKSVPLLRQAATLGPDDPQVLLRVAIGFEFLHDRRQALEWLSRAMAHGLSPSAVVRENSLAALRRDPSFSQLVARYQSKPQNGR
jgi:serine/threonine-protein kinase